MKKISDICQDSNEIFGNVLQELQIAKSNRNIDENIVYEIANETEKLSGVLKHVKREENNMITKIEQYLQDSKNQQIEAEKSMVNLPGIYPTDKKKTTKLEEFIDRVFHIFLPTVTADHNSNDEISIPCSTNLENSANTVSKDSINSFETVKSLQNCNEKEHVSPLLKEFDTLEALAVQTKNLSIRFESFRKTVDRSASFLSTYIRDPKLSGWKLKEPLKEDKTTFDSMIEVQAINMINITKVLQQSFDTIDKEARKNIVPTHFISENRLLNMST
ncbi:uncharacterized protein EV154DRAFT_607852 [Mucor mucedo]|uniref:uncharacterized protein n=1 Tax=Mucor mucedo TaxID=29922 RepID=UPI00221F8770|nr:uncharacterized protein EV154DRAFT_607852 [Mucor mucedo]KAI7868211.1 hypothetical protein EV154DRAFT_607852 [Mucor mucedo]